MLQILTLTITALREKLYVTFMIIVKNLLDEFEVVNEKFEYYVNQFKAAYDRLNYVYLKTDLKFYTEQVQEKDTLRCTAFRSLRDMVRYHFNFPADKAKGEAARILLEVIKLYGTDIPGMKMNERTAQLVNLIEDFEDKYKAQVTAIGVGDLLTALSQAQEQFMAVYSARTDVDSTFGLNAMIEARKKMDEAYRNLVLAVNLEAKRDVQGLLTDFINNMNVEIRRQFINTGQHSSNSSTNRPSDGEGEGGGTETTPTMKNATFKKADGTSVVIPFEVGTVIVYPDNTVGYKWSPNLEFMPKTNKNFKEVPIVDRETIALFHFADHTEEEIKQYVGTILNAPQNTEGYRWDPAVPELMPAEDTQYYELPIENNDDNQGGGDQGGSTGGDNNGGSTGGGTGGNYPPGYDPDADLDPGV